ncbi:MAG: beta strand repeat-containing protein [Terriglobales bacterium]
MNCRRLVVACAPGGIFVAVAVLMAMAATVLMLGPHARDVVGYASTGTGGPSHLKSTQGAMGAVSAYHRLPLIFEPNQGQSDREVKFLARGGGYGVFLTADKAVLTLRHSAAGTRHSVPQSSVLGMTLEGASGNSAVSGTDELPGKSNYFIGNDPAQWHTDIPQFARVRYRGVYPGIDLVYYGKQGQLEYDFEAAPGSDPAKVAIRFQGAGNLSIDAAGDLVLAVGDGHVTLKAPRVYQRFGEEERKVDGRFELRGKDRVGFALGAYDQRRALVIDPVLTYSTYLGGSSDEACTVILGVATGVAGCPAVAVDTSLNAYIAGSTMSINFPPAGLPFQSGLEGTANVFIAKFNSTANTLLFSTYLGGNTVDTTAGLAVDAGGNVTVAGNTTSSNFPTHGTNAAFQTTPLSTHNHVFVSKLDSLGHTLIYSTYLSGNGVDTATGLALDLSANAYVTGTTTSTESLTGFPSTLGAYQTVSNAPSQFFLTKVNPSLSGVNSVPYSTYFGGSTPSIGETMGGGVAVDANANVYITGGTTFTNLPVLNAYQGTLAGGLDVFVAEINPAAVTGTQLLYCTYLGGTGDDIGYGIAVDSALSAYVTGSTTSTDFPVAGTGVFQPTLGGGTDAFLAKLGAPTTSVGVVTGTVPLDYFTYLGGSGDDVGLGIVVDNSGQALGSSQGARITGWTASADFPVRNNPVQPGFGGDYDAFVARIDTTATTPTAAGHYATFLGGNNADFGTGIAVDFQGASYVAGETKSANFLTQAPPLTASFQPSLNGGSDAFLSKLGPVLDLQVSVVASPTTVGVGNQVTFTYTIENAGDFASGITFTDTLPTSDATFVSATTSNSSNSCGQPSGGTVVCNIGALNSGGTGESGGTATVTVILTPIANTTPQTSPISLSNSGSVTVAGSTFTQGAGTTVTVNDFTLNVAPSTATVPAGVPAQYTATMAPTGIFTGTISVSCSSGLPTAGTCTETTPSFQNLNGSVSTDLIINTVARVTTTTHLYPGGGLFYAMGLPVLGLAVLGVSMGRVSRSRRVVMSLLLGGFFALMAFQAGCGSSKTVTTTTGTPAGTYVVTVSAISGSATRTQTVTLVVQ